MRPPQMRSRCGNTGCQAVLFSTACQLLRPLKSPFSCAHGVSDRTADYRPSSLRSRVYLRGLACHCLVSLLSGFGDGRNTASRSVHNYLRCGVAHLYLITHSLDFRILFFGVRNDSFHFVL